MENTPFARDILPHVVQIAAGLCSNSALAAVGPDQIAVLSIDQLQAIYAELELEWLEFRGEGKE